MKTIIYISIILAGITLLASCSDVGKKIEEHEDTLWQADSIASTDAMKTQQETLRQDSINKAEREKYDQMISECEYLANISNNTINKVRNSMRCEADLGDPRQDYENFLKKYKQIIQIIDSLSPEQFKRVEVIEETTLNPYGTIWG